MLSKKTKSRPLTDGTHAMVGIQLGTQLLLWIFFDAYDRALQTVWQAALMTAIPLLLLLWVWHGADPHSPSAKWFALPLTLCLFADAALMTSALGGFVGQLVPHYPMWVSVLAPAAVCWLTALCARTRGVRYASQLLALPLSILLLLGTVFLRASTRADRLWPILGDGLFSTAKTALLGAGAGWGISLGVVFPQKRTKMWKTFLLYCCPWALCVLCALWFGFLRPWAAGDALPVAEKMMGLARHAHSVLLYEATGVMWMLLIPTALTACFASSGEIIRRAFPSLPVWASLLPAAAVALALQAADFHSLLPFRYLVALGCGLALRIDQRSKA